MLVLRFDWHILRRENRLFDRNHLNDSLFDDMWHVLGNVLDRVVVDSRHFSRYLLDSASLLVFSNSLLNGNSLNPLASLIVDDLVLERDVFDSAVA